MKRLQIRRGFILGVLLGGMLLLLTGLSLAAARAPTNPVDSNRSQPVKLADYALTANGAYTVYLPLVFRHWPPIPYAPTLNAIANSDGDGNYTVTWSDDGLTDTFYLEEDDNSSFSSPTAVYTGTTPSWTVPAPGKPTGTFYYRVRGHNSWGYGNYSNIRSVTVTVSPIWADDYDLEIRDCTTLRWDFTGIKAIYISFGLGYDKEAVVGQDSREICPSYTTTYEALVIKQDDSEEIYSTTVNVDRTGANCANDAAVLRFDATSYEVAPGEKFTIYWNVACAKSVRLVYGLNEIIVDPDDHFDDMQIYGDTVFQLKIERYILDYVFSSFEVKIKP